MFGGLGRSLLLAWPNSSSPSLDLFIYSITLSICLTHFPFILVRIPLIKPVFPLTFLIPYLIFGATRDKNPAVGPRKSNVELKNAKDRKNRG